MMSVNIEKATKNIAPLLWLLFFLCFPAALYAVPANPMGAELQQPDGTTVKIYLRGDEHFSWHEDRQGFVVRRDPKDSYWKYARPKPDSTRFEILKDAVVGFVDPVALGLTKRNLPDRTLLRRLYDRSPPQILDSISPTSSESSPSPSAEETTQSPPPPQRMPVSGNTAVTNIVILASFADHWDNVGGTVSSSHGRTDTREYENLFNEIGHTTDGAAGSVKDYYLEVSYGKLELNSVITGWVKLPHDQAYYGAADPDTGTNDADPRKMTEDAIAAAEAAGFDFSQGDSDGDGWVDSLTIIHSGHGQDFLGNSSNAIWSHYWWMLDPITYDGVQMQRYHTEPALRDSDTSSTSIIRIGVIAHELGHFFGLADLYDYSKTTRGLGAWCLMGYGSWNGSDGKSPAHLSAYPKSMLGFVTPSMQHSGTSKALARVEDNAEVHLYRDGMGNEEYFLVENRARHGFDNTSEIHPGIVIYHVDPKSTNNDLRTWDHPMVKIEEADGNNSLGLLTADSEAGDVWTSTSGLNGGLNDHTNDVDSNTMMYQSGHAYNRSDNPTSYSYLQFANFSAAGETMTYDALTLLPEVNSTASSTGDYTVTWSAATNATQYRIEEGGDITLTSFSDGPENDASMYDNWAIQGNTHRSTGGSRSGAYSYVLQSYNNDTDVYYSTVQGLTSRIPFMVTGTTNISFYYISQLSTDAGYLKYQISRDGGNSWLTLGTLHGQQAQWAQVNIGFSELNNAGIEVGDHCIFRFIANFERIWGWSAWPSFGYAIDDFQITNVEIASYGNWTVLSDNVPTNSYQISDKPNGRYAYQVKAYSNGLWQDYGTPGVVTVDAPSYAFSKKAPADGTTTQSTNMFLSWSGVNSASSYEYCYDSTNNDTCDATWSSAGTSTSTDISGLTAGNTYYWQVRANVATVAAYADDNIWWSFTVNTVNTTHTLSYSAGGNGSLSGSTSQTVEHGTSGTAVTANPDTGYHFVQWSDGSTDNPRTDSNITDDINVIASFAINQYSLEYSANANGSLSGSTSQTVEHGASGTAVTANPDTGYHFVQWSDGSTDNPRTDSNVTTDINVSASFSSSGYMDLVITDDDSTLACKAMEVFYDGYAYQLHDVLCLDEITGVPYSDDLIFYDSNQVIPKSCQFGIIYREGDNIEIIALGECVEGAISAQLTDTDADGIPNRYDVDPFIYSEIYGLPCGDGDIDYLNISDVTYFADENIQCQADKAIATGRSVTLNSNSEVSYSSPFIYLAPGFTVNQGALFHAGQQPIASP
jgi:M6 family metalloprotease-like protein